MNESKLNKLFLEVKSSKLQTPEERILTAFNSLELALKIKDAAKKVVNNLNES